MQDKRIFIAIAISEKIVDYLIEECSYLPSPPSLKWTLPENLHVTVHFIGESSINQISMIEKKISSVVKEFQPFSIELKSIETVMRDNQPSMIWATFHENKLFIELATEIIENLGSVVKNKPFPHITLARFRSGSKIKALDIHPPVTLEQMSVKVNQVELWESELKPKGPIYTQMKVFPLGK